MPPKHDDDMDADLLSWDHSDGEISDGDWDLSHAAATAAKNNAAAAAPGAPQTRPKTPPPLPPAAVAASFPWLYAAVESRDVEEAKKAYKALIKLAGPGEAGARLIHAPGGEQSLSPLERAAELGDAKMIGVLGAMAPPSLDEPSEETGLTPLALAVVNGHKAAVRALLSIGCDPNARLGPAHKVARPAGGTALHAAASAAVRDARVYYYRGGPALEAAERLRDWSDAGLEALLDVTEQRVLRAQAAALAAATAGAAAAAAAPAAAAAAAETSTSRLRPAPPAPVSPQLRRRRADLIDLDARDAQGRTPLMLALRFGRGRAARLLLEHGADNDAEDHSGRPALTHLFEGARERLFDIDEEIFVRLLLASGARSHIRRDTSGSCPVFLASANARNDNVLRLLLDAPGGRKALRARDRSGRGALHYALDPGLSRYGVSLRAPIVRLLLSRGADASAADNQGRVPAFGAVARADVESLRLLLDATPPTDPSSADKTGNTLLMTALQASPYPMPCALLLLQRGADVRARDSEGNTAADFLLRATTTLWGSTAHGVHPWRPPGYIQMMTELLRAGAPFNRSLYDEEVLAIMPAVLKAGPARAAQELEARRSERRRVFGHEDLAGLAMDMLEVRELEAAVAAREARVQELEGLIEEAGGGGSSSATGGAGGGGSSDPSVCGGRSDGGGGTVGSVGGGGGFNDEEGVDDEMVA